MLLADGTGCGESHLCPHLPVVVIGVMISFWFLISGMEAILLVDVENFPAFIVVDNKGNNFYQQWQLE